MKTIVADVVIDEGMNLGEAAKFYERFFDTPATQDVDGSWLIEWDDSVTFRITHSPQKSQIGYKKGKTPRFGLGVEGIDVWIDAVVEAGAQVTGLIDDASYPTGRAYTNVFVIDPYGHAWRFIDIAAAERSRDWKERQALIGK